MASYDELQQMTKAELLALVQKQEVEIEEVKQEVKELKAEGSGWLITTPNPTYDGVTMNINFVNGMAFIPEKRVYHRHVIPDPKPEALEKMDDKSLNQLKEAQKIPTSKKMAEQLRDDFGYTIEYFNEDNLDEIPKRIEARAKERARAIEDAERLAQAQSIMTPHVMG